MRALELLLENTAVNLVNRTGENNQKDSFEDWWNYEVKMNINYNKELITKFLPAIKKKYLAAIFSLANQTDTTGLIGSPTGNRPVAYSVNPNPVNDNFYQIMIPNNDQARRQNVMISKKMVDNDPKMSAALEKGFLYYIELDNIRTTNLMELFHALETLATISVKKAGDVAKDQANKIVASGLSNDQKKMAFSELKTSTSRYAKEVQQAAKNKLNSMLQNKSYADLYNDVINTRNKLIQSTNDIFTSKLLDNADSGLKLMNTGTNVSIYLITSSEVALKEGQNLKNCIGSYYTFDQDAGHFVSGSKMYDIFVCKTNDDMTTVAAFRMNTSHNELYEVKGYNNTPPNPETTKDVITYLNTKDVDYTSAMRDIENSGLYFDTSTNTFKSYDEYLIFKDIDTLENGDLVSEVTNLSNVPDKILDVIIPDYSIAQYFVEGKTDKYRLLYIRSPQKSIIFAVICAAGQADKSNLSLSLISRINGNQQDDFISAYNQNAERTIKKYSRVINYILQKGYADNVNLIWEVLLGKAGYTIKDKTVKSVDEVYPSEYVLTQPAKPPFGELEVYKINIPSTILKDLAKLRILQDNSGDKTVGKYVIYQEKQIALGFVVDETSSIPVIDIVGKGDKEDQELIPLRSRENLSDHFNIDQLAELFVNLAKKLYPNNYVEVLAKSLKSGINLLHQSKILYNLVQKQYDSDFIKFASEFNLENGMLPYGAIFASYPAIIYNYNSLNDDMKNFVKSFVDITDKMANVGKPKDDGRAFKFEPNYYDGTDNLRLPQEIIESDLYQLHADTNAKIVNNFVTGMIDLLNKDMSIISTNVRLTNDTWGLNFLKHAGKSKKYKDIVEKNLNTLKQFYIDFNKKFEQQEKDPEFLDYIFKFINVPPVFEDMLKNTNMEPLKTKSMQTTLEYIGKKNNRTQLYNFKIKGKVPDFALEKISLEQVEDKNLYYAFSDYYNENHPLIHKDNVENKNYKLNLLRDFFPISNQNQDNISVKFLNSYFEDNSVKDIPVGTEISNVSLYYIDNPYLKDWLDSDKVADAMQKGQLTKGFMLDMARTSLREANSDIANVKRKTMFNLDRIGDAINLLNL
tara:strand:- start:1249 stop:4503 length:3255 start_codon:yes stop_codon:yes gene_type:complete